MKEEASEEATSEEEASGKATSREEASKEAAAKESASDIILVYKSWSQNLRLFIVFVLQKWRPSRPHHFNDRRQGYK